MKDTVKRMKRPITGRKCLQTIYWTNKLYLEFIKIFQSEQQPKKNPIKMTKYLIFNLMFKQ